MHSASTGVHEALAAARRRLVCQYVADTDESVPVEDLATWLLSEERADTGKPHADPGDHRQIATQLHHRHLPKLAETGVLRYDSDQCLIRPGPELPAALELIHEG